MFHSVVSLDLNESISVDVTINKIAYQLYDILDIRFQVS